MNYRLYQFEEQDEHEVSGSEKREERELPEDEVDSLERQVFKRSLNLLFMKKASWYSDNILYELVYCQICLFSFFVNARQAELMQ